MISSTKKGFTLIELLLVISIISLLSSIFISQVQDSRKKANRAAVKQEVASLKTEAEIYYLNNGQKYTNSSVPMSGDCFDSANKSQWGFLKSEKGQELLNSLKKRTGNQNATCSINQQSYAVSIDILEITISSNNLLAETAYAASDGYICFDSSGSAGSFTSGSYSSDSSGVNRESNIRLETKTNKFVCK
jgi:prepilin-type N-terminal cleavage/methylation domain-containing protein